MPIYESMSQYARRCGVSRVTIFNHCRTGRVLRSEKGINPGLPINMEYEQGLEKKRQNNKAKVSGKTIAKKKPAIVEIIDDDSLNGQPDEGFIHRSELERMKVAEQILKTRVETEQKRGELLDKKLTKRVMAKIFAVDTAELHPLGEKIAADIAAKFKSDDSQAILETRQIIDRHIFNALQHIKRLMNDYFDKIGEEKI